MTLKNIFPPIDWLKSYKLKDLGSDTLAGLTLTAYAIPVSLAYATLAGLPPQYGIFGYLLGGLFYSFLGSSKQLAVGPTSAISMLVGTTLAVLSKGDPQRWLELSSLTAIMVAAISFAAYLLKLSSIINFINETVLTGFKAGAALTIMLTQLPKMLGVPGGGGSFFNKLFEIFKQLPQTHEYVLLYGLAAFALILIGEKVFQGKPVAIYVVIVSILIISFTSLEEQGFKTVGVIPTGLPSLGFPSLNWADIQAVSSLAFACFLLMYVESISAAKSLAQ